MKTGITKLVDDCLLFLSNQSYSPTRISQHKNVWDSGIVHYMEQRHITEYTSDIGKSFILQFISLDKAKAEDREIIKSIQILDDYLNLGYIRESSLTHFDYPLWGEIGKHIGDFIHQLEYLRRSPRTIQEYKFYLSRFHYYLYQMEVMTPDDITETLILKFVSIVGNKAVSVYYLRALFRYWDDRHVTNENLAVILHGYKWVRREKIPSYYSADEIHSIEQSIERSSPNGKRNYAMVLLASRLGLRVSDIAALRFENIDWEKNEIRLKQFKTGKSIVLPLLSNVGNAIIDYIRYGRQTSESQQVFLSCKSPYNPVTSHQISDVISTIITKTAINTTGRHHSPHALRHSLASQLLETGTPYPVISETLGHTKTDVTMAYLRIDLISLQKCALPVSTISDDFYTQKGGFFYA
jgi:site-specific recombinase XerD